ncbi:hypothetical protein Sjap_024812 [Stephania japonica]|uniref:Homeobox domain-containing protein n=1 Tax=Stephania japonica TaxID=461633 RepID=A0AAP0HQG7_9MAGN
MKMWMMGCSDGGGFNIADSLNGRRLRPLIPRPSSVSSSSATTATVTSSTTTAAAATTNTGGFGGGGVGTNVPCFSNRIHGSHDNHFVFNHHLMATTASYEQISKKDFGAPTVVSSRWNPTPEQLRTLEELYRHGTRTPTAEQIQQITAQLRRFGKIEGKNVFYWFQNHKARERQKRRRRLECEERDNNRNETLDNKESGSNRTTDFEVEAEAETNKTCWATLPTHTFTTFSEEMMWRPVVSESKTNGWMRFEDLELQKSIEKQQTWQPMQLCCSSSPTTTTTPTTTTAAAETMRILNSSSKLFMMPNNHQNHAYPLTSSPIGVLNDHRYQYRRDGQCRDDHQSHTLQLFPLRSTRGHEDNELQQHVKENESEMDANSSAPYEFIEFL